MALFLVFAVIGTVGTLRRMGRSAGGNVRR